MYLTNLGLRLVCCEFIYVKAKLLYDFLPEYDMEMENICFKLFKKPFKE